MKELQHLLKDTSSPRKCSVEMFLKVSHFLFFNCYLAAPQPALGHYRECSLTHVNHCVFLHFRPDVHQQPRNEVGSLNQPSA